jgi:putative phosphoesterase
MKAALLGDVHANLPALEAVLAHAEGEGVEVIWNVGDLVGYNAFPEEVVQRLRAEGALSVIGNYDLKVLKFPKKDDKWRRKKRPEKWRAFKWAYENLSEESRTYLASLPREVRLRIDGRTVLLTHGSPASVSEHLYADTPEERLRELAALAEADVIVMGHSHRAFVRKVNDVWFINTGSVGRQDDGDPRAGYAVLNLHDGDVRVQHHRIEYDVAAATAAIREAGLPREFEEMMRRGRKLDWILERSESC